LWGIITSPDGRYVYAADYADDLLTVFKVLPDNGLQRLAVYQDGVNGVNGMDGPRAIAISPDGSALYVSARLDDAVVAFMRNPETGLLTYMHHVAEGAGYNCEFLGSCANTIDGLEEPYELVVSPDNRYLYVTAEQDDAIVVFRLGTSGMITDAFIGAYIVEIIKMPNLDGARGLALSPAGNHLYVASGVADSLIVFERNSQTGKLSVVEQFVDAAKLDGAGKLLVSHDGRHLYIGSYFSDNLLVYQRNAFTGKLTFIKEYTNSMPGFTNRLDYPGGMALSPDGRYLYVPSFLNSRLGVFVRSADTGLLSPWGQNITQPELDGAFGVALGPDGRTAYVAPYNTSAVVVFQPSNPAPAINTLLPASAAGGSNNFQLTIVGENFTPASVVQWNGTPRETTFVSESELKMTVQATDVPANPAVTEAAVSVHNPAPGGGAATRSFIITQSPTANPVPSIAQLAPQSVPVGTDDFTLTIYGAGFIPSSQVQWNGVTMPTTYVNGTELTIVVLIDQLLQAGTAVVTVQNPAPVGGASNNAPFDVVAVGQNPTPTLTELTPKHTIARGPASKQVVVTVRGMNFHEDAQAQWNGFNRPTTVVSETELRVTLTAADVAEGGVGGIRVLNPEPGGGASNTLSFAVHAHAIYLPLMIR
jgi:6-phosphogluconolactonase (cycloisomerase 2 family)